MEAEGATGKQADARVQALDDGVGEAVNEGVEDRFQVLVDALDQLLKGLPLRGFTDDVYTRCIRLAASTTVDSRAIMRYVHLGPPSADAVCRYTTLASSTSSSSQRAARSLGASKAPVLVFGPTLGRHGR